MSDSSRRTDYLAPPSIVWGVETYRTGQELRRALNSWLVQRLDDSDLNEVVVDGKRFNIEVRVALKPIEEVSDASVAGQELPLAGDAPEGDRPADKAAYDRPTRDGAPARNAGGRFAARDRHSDQGLHSHARAQEGGD